MKKRLFVILAVTLILLPLAVYFFAGWNVRSNAQVSLSRAQRLLAERQPDAALDQLHWLRWFEPDQPQANLIAGECYFVKKQYPEAISLLSHFDSASPYYLRASFALARSYENTAQMEEAERILKQHLEVSPGSQEAVTELQWLYFNQFRLRELQDLLERSLDYCPNKYLLLFHLLNSEHKKPIAQESIRNLNRINEVKPNQPSIMRAIGYSHWKLGEIEQAKTFLEASRRLQPENLETTLICLEFYLELGELETLKKLLTEIQNGSESFQTQLKQDDRWHWLLSRLELQTGETEAALKSIQEASRLKAKQIHYVQQEAMILQALGKKADAALKFQEAQKLAASHRELYKIVSSGALDSPTVELGNQIAVYLETLGYQNQARAWRDLVQQFQSLQPTSPP
ncbi:MAG: tetratricopeptide repeat protein [Planctomycetota bacterium]